MDFEGPFYRVQRVDSAQVEVESGEVAEREKNKRAAEILTPGFAMNTQFSGANRWVKTGQTVRIATRFPRIPGGLPCDAAGRWAR